MKKCTKCSEVKPLSAFYWRAARSTYYPECKDCRDTVARAHALRRKYGLTVEAYEQMKSARDGCCDICKEPERQNKDLAVDHCHSTGKVRGLLCSNCNTGIGKLRDDPAVIRSAADYLERTR